MAAIVPFPRHRHIQQLANMLRDKSMSLKVENIIVSLCIYLLFKDTLHRQHTVPKFLRVASVGRHAESIIVSEGGTESMILSAPMLRLSILSALALSA
jgi:hypothetical protein